MTTGALERAAARPWSKLASLAGAGLVAALLVTIYHRTAATLWSTWTTNDNYSHGPLVPLVSLALIWRSRGRLGGVPYRGDARGLPLVALACLLQMVGMRSNVFALEGYSMIVMAFGLSLTFFGPAPTSVLAFPLAYLAFMLVFPPFIVTRLSYALKEITVRASTQAATILGVVLQRNGMSLILPEGTLRIENPCSGLRSLVALLATGAVFAHLQPGGAWRRLVVFVAAVPIAMIGNAVRITAVILVAHYAGIRRATGAFHDWTGYLLFAVALVGLYALRLALTPRAMEPKP